MRLAREGPRTGPNKPTTGRQPRTGSGQAQTSREERQARGETRAGPDKPTTARQNFDKPGKGPGQGQTSLRQANKPGTGPGKAQARLRDQTGPQQSQTGTSPDDHNGSARTAGDLCARDEEERHRQASYTGAEITSVPCYSQCRVDPPRIRGASQAPWVRYCAALSNKELQGAM